MKLTKVMKKEYIDHVGTICPYCGSVRTIDNVIRDNGSYCSRGVSCVDCNKQWVDVYTLTDIEEV